MTSVPAVETTKPETATKTEESPRKVAPAITPGLVSISMQPTDLVTLTNLMSACAKMFEEQALVAAQQNDEKNYTIHAARCKLSSMFASQFNDFCKVGEPESREFH